MGPTLATVISTGMNLAGSYFSQQNANKIAEERNKQQRQWQLEDRQHDEMYNSAAMQRQRMYDAGIGGDYSSIVSSTPTQSTTPEVSSPDNAMASLGSLGNSAAAAYNSTANTGINEYVSKADYDAKKAAAIKAAADAEKTCCETKWIDAEKGVDIAFKSAQTQSVDIANNLADATKGYMIQLKNYEMQTAYINMQGASLRNTGLQLENNFTELKISDLSFKVSDLNPLSKENLEKMNSLLQANEKLTQKQIENIEPNTLAAWFEVNKSIASNYFTEETIKYLESNRDKVAESIAHDMMASFSNSKANSKNASYNEKWNSGFMSDFNDYSKMTFQTALGFAKVAIGASYLNGSGLNLNTSILNPYRGFNTTPQFNSY